MTALASGNPFGTLFGASDLKARGRSHLRRGLFVSGALHLLLLAALMPLWSGAGDSLLRTIPGDVTLLPSPPTLIDVPPPDVSTAPPAVAPAPRDLGELVLTEDRGVDIPSIDFAPVPAGQRGAEGRDGGASPRAGEGAAPTTVAEPPEPGFTYFDTAPVAISSPKPAYPEWAREAGVSGRVVLHVLVGSDGSVRRVLVKEGVTGLNEAAQAAVSRWVFRPALANGHPVPVWVVIPVLFRL